MSEGFIQKKINKPWIYPLLLFIIGMLSYVISNPKLGFYWDDWQAVYLFQTHSTPILNNYFLYDRPFSSWTYEVLFPIVKMHPLGWQVLTLVFRILAVWLTTESLISIWQNKKNFFRWIGVLLIVFPGFSLQSISVAFNQHFITFLLFSISIYSMVMSARATRWRKWGWTFLSITTGLCELFTMEYFIGLEAIRPLLLWFIYDSLPNARSNEKFKAWVFTYIPYVFMAGGFIFWRLLIYPTQIIPGAELDDPNTPVLLLQVLQKPLETITALGNLVLQDIVYLLTQNWLRPITPSSIRFDSKYFLLAWSAGLVVSGCFVYWISCRGLEDDTNDSSKTNFHIALLGFVALLSGGMPVWVTNRQILEGKWSDRFSLAPSIGAVLLLVLLITWIIRTKRQKVIILFVFLAGSISYQMQVTHKYGLDWDLQRGYYWQMIWRAPALKPQTAVFSAGVPSTFSSHYSAGFALESLYGNEPLSTELDTWYFRPNDVGINFFKLAPGYAINYKFRNVTFTGNTSNSIAVMYKPASGCLLVLDEAYRGNPAIDENHEMLIPLTNQTQIQNRIARQPDPDIFGEEPPHDWCFYFEKADLAREERDWLLVNQLFSEAEGLGLSPKSGVELLPAFEAAYYQGMWSNVQEIAQQMIGMNSANDSFLCIQMDRLAVESGVMMPDEHRNAINLIVNCEEVFAGN